MDHAPGVLMRCDTSDALLIIREFVLCARADVIHTSARPAHPWSPPNNIHTSTARIGHRGEGNKAITTVLLSSRKT